MSPLTPYPVARRSYARLSGLFFILLVLVSLQPAAWAAATSKDKNVVKAVLANGMRVIIVRDALAPVVSSQVNYLVGSNEAPAGFPGTAHAVEHMMFRGSPGMSAAQLADITAAMGGEFDADTQQTVTQYAFTVPTRDLKVALHIEAIRMRSILATQKLWGQERGAIEQEVAQDLSSPQYVFYTRLLASLFKGTPYAHDALGTRPSFDKTTGTMLRKFHQTWYAPNNAVLVITGNVDPAATLGLVRSLFEKIPSRKLPKRPSVKLQPVKPETLELKTDLPYGMAIIAFRGPGFRDPDYPAAAVLEDVLDSQRGKLYGLVPAGRALDAGFSLDGLPKGAVAMAIATFPKDSNAPSLVKTMRGILRDYAKHGVPPGLVAAAKRRTLAAAEFQKNSVAGLTDAWSQAVAVEGKSSPEAAIAAISHVTVKDVNRVARQMLDPARAVTGILTPQTSGKPVSGSGFGGKESFAPKQPKVTHLPKWARLASRKLEIPHSVIHPVVSTLPNGIHLIVQSEHISHTVSVYGHIRNNPLLEVSRGQEGAARVLDQLFSYGSHSLNRLAFRKALDDIGAEAGAGTDFSLQVLTSHFDRGVQLLADNELRPALPQEAFHVIRRQLRLTVAGELQSPQYLTRRALNKALFPKHDPTLRQTTPATVKYLTLKDIKHYYHTAYRPDMTTIVVIGDVTPAGAKAVIEKYFGAWRAHGPKPKTLLAPVPPNPSSTAAIPDSSRVQDQVTLAESLTLNRSNPDYYALELGNHVLGGAFYATRLYRDLREKNGLVYYVGSDFDMGLTRAVYHVDYACDPDNVSRVRTIVERELRMMQKEPVTKDELAQAKRLLLTQIPLSESSVDAIAGGILARVALKLPLDEPTRAARRYLKLTAPQVQSAFAKWVDVKRLVQVSEGPTPK